MVQEHLKNRTQHLETGAFLSSRPHDHLQAEIADMDQKISEALARQQAFYNPKWDRVFRAGAEESYFANQVERYACIYMEKLADLLEHSPLTYFRANRRLLPHDLDT